MNKEILMVMRWLENSKSVSLDGLKRNMDNSYAYANSYPHRGLARLATSCAASAAFDAASYAFYGALHPDVHEDAAHAHDAINEYFKFFGENKQDYIDELERTK